MLKCVHVLPTAINCNHGARRSSHFHFSLRLNQSLRRYLLPLYQVLSVTQEAYSKDAGHTFLVAWCFGALVWSSAMFSSEILVQHYQERFLPLEVWLGQSACTEEILKLYWTLWVGKVSHSQIGFYILSKISDLHLTCGAQVTMYFMLLTECYNVFNVADRMLQCIYCCWQIRLDPLLQFSSWGEFWACRSHQ